jgi:hypothetical protein
LWPSNLLVLRKEWEQVAFRAFPTLVVCERRIACSCQHLGLFVSGVFDRQCFCSIDKSAVHRLARCMRESVMSSFLHCEEILSQLRSHSSIDDVFGACCRFLYSIINSSSRRSSVGESRRLRARSIPRAVLLVCFRYGALNSGHHGHQSSPLPVIPCYAAVVLVSKVLVFRLLIFG